MQRNYGLDYIKKKKDMLTIKQITEDTDKVIRGLEKKHFANAKETIAKVLELNDQRQKLLKLV